MSGEWSVRLRVTDFGAWHPDDEKQAAELIRVVNEARCEADGDARPVIRRIWWRDQVAESPYLEVQIAGALFTLNPGEHLVRTTLPDGSAEWGGMDEDLLAKLGGQSPAEPTGELREQVAETPSVQQVLARLRAALDGSTPASPTREATP